MILGSVLYGGKPAVHRQGHHVNMTDETAVEPHGAAIAGVGPGCVGAGGEQRGDDGGVAEVGRDVEPAAAVALSARNRNVARPTRRCEFPCNASSSSSSCSIARTELSRPGASALGRSGTCRP